MGGIHRDLAADLIERGHVLLVEGKTRGSEAAKWKKSALKLLKYLDDDLYEQRRREYTGFTEWATSAISPRAAAAYVERTLDALERACRAPDKPDDPGSDLQQKRVTSEEMRLVEETAATLGVELPGTIIKGTGAGDARYAPSIDRMVIPDRNFYASDDEFKSTVGHELGHKKQHEDTMIPGAYLSARSGLRELARQLVRPDDSLPLHLQATTMLAGVGAYTTFVLLGKTVGHRLELEADLAGAKASSPEARASAMRKAATELEAINVERVSEKTWAERVMSRVALALEDEHPSYQTRINRVMARGADLDGDSRTR
jgi:hypothetical protein